MAQDCPQCHYTPSNKKKEEKEECPQCFYEQKAADEKKEEEADCAQCFYESKPEKEPADCAQCFYESKPEKEPDECAQCFYDVAAIREQEESAETKEEKKRGVVIYTMPECGFCRMVMDFLKAREIAFEEVSIPSSKEAQHFMESHGYISAPVTVIGDKEIMGAEIAEIKKALGL